ncbi:hypothetical protein PR048_020452 [Dryococelus australis]|uniref:Uncharacterized protein n=1 Tax=Dryococelus australis TaxID=614101 RepID=A0ABQ9H6G4_9NEOP|nr:hypothetical protein PR048_020452 [Dryococelus australis]
MKEQWRNKGSGYKLYVQKLCRANGKAYKIYKNEEKPAKKPPAEQEYPSHPRPKKKKGEFICEMKRGRLAKPNKLSNEARESIKDHTNSIHHEHPGLNVHRLFKAFKDTNHSTKVPYRDHGNVYKDDLICNSDLHVQTLAEPVTYCNVKRNHAKPLKSREQLGQHHKNSEEAMKRLKYDSGTSQMHGRYISVTSIDMQQVMVVPTLVHSYMFYMRHLSCYNFCVHACDFNKAYMCTWHEITAGGGGNEIVSCLLHCGRLDQPQSPHAAGFNVQNSIGIKGYSTERKLYGSQKNRMMVFLFVDLA